VIIVTEIIDLKKI